MKRTTTAYLALLSACFLTSLIAPAIAQERLDREVTFDIQPQLIEAALLEFSQQANIQVMMVSPAMPSYRTEGVKGKLAVAEALKQLLRNTGLHYEVGGENTVRIVSTREAASTGAMAAPMGEAVTLARNEETAARDTGNPVREAKEGENASSERLDEIVVTGTHIRNAAPTGSPLRSLSREDIDASGAVSTAQLIESLPQNFGGGISETTSAIFVPNDGKTERNASQGTGVNLRGLGSDATLVLINGHRLTQTGAGDFVDISQIPISAIDRVDILTDGASAIYGSDAVAGVVNIVLRNHFDGIETRVRHGSVTDGSFDQTGAGFTLGHSREGGGVLLNYDYFEQGELSSADRAFARDPVGDLIPEQRMQNVIVNGSERIGNASLRYDALYTHRHTHFLVPVDVISIVADEIRDTPSDAYSGSVGLDLPVTSTWTASVGALYSASHIATESHALDAAFLGRRVFRDELSSLNASLAGKILSLPAGPIRTTLGADFRREQAVFKRFTPSIIGVTEQRRERRDVKGAYAEALIPLLAREGSDRNRLDLSLAVRHEDYSDLGGTTNPKVGISWAPASGIRLRSTYGTSFRAASFTQADVAHNQTFFLDFPDPDFDNTSLTLFQVGNSTELAPEKSRSWDFGLDLTPPTMPGLRVSLDYFHTRFRNRIQTPSATAFDVLALEEVYASIVTRDPSAALLDSIIANPGADGLTDLTFGLSNPQDAVVVIDNRTQNTGATLVSGLDLSIGHELEWNAVRWRFSLDATRLLKWENQITPQSSGVDITGTLFSPPKWRARGGVVAERGPFQASAFAAFVPSYTNNQVLPALPISSWTTVDVSLAYRTADAAPGILGNLQLRLTARNLFDRAPPFVSSTGNAGVLPVGFDAANASPVGRFVNLELSKRF